MFNLYHKQLDFIKRIIILLGLFSLFDSHFMIEVIECFRCTFMLHANINIATFTFILDIEHRKQHNRNKYYAFRINPVFRLIRLFIVILVVCVWCPAPVWLTLKDMTYKKGTFTSLIFYVSVNGFLSRLSKNFQWQVVVPCPLMCPSFIEMWLRSECHFCLRGFVFKWFYFTIAKQTRFCLKLIRQKNKRILR